MGRHYLLIIGPGASGTFVEKMTGLGAPWANDRSSSSVADTP
jgi:hypothetical protein